MLRLDPNTTWSNTLTAAPILSFVLTEGTWSFSTTDTAKPNLANPLKLRLDPNETESKTETEHPILAKLRKLSIDPNTMASETEAEEETLT